jgi:hypothetical protein
MRAAPFAVKTEATGAPTSANWLRGKSTRQNLSTIATGTLPKLSPAI